MLKNFDITVIGDSIAKGLYLENNKIMRIKNSAINLSEEYFGIKTDNLSVFGQSLKKSVLKGCIDTYIKNNASNSNKIVVLALGGNDCDYNWEAVGEKPEEMHLPTTPPSEFYAMLCSVIQNLKSTGARVCLAALPPILSDRYFNEIISKRADGKGVLKFFTGDITNISRHHECYNNLILRAALNNSCPFIDYRTDFLLKNDMPSYICDDGIHPNEKGHALMFYRIKQIVEGSTFINKNEPARLAQGS